MLENEFRSPSDWCRGTDFWMLNDELDEQEMCRQLCSMKEQGVRSVIVRTYMGLRSDYPGKDWMGKMHAIVSKAKEIGLTLVMQAGYMPEAVLKLPEKYFLGNLCCFEAEKGQGMLLDSYDGVDYCVVPSVRILDMLDEEACAFYVRQSYGDFWKEFQDEYGKTIISVWVDEPSMSKVSLPWTRNLPKAYEMLWNEPFDLSKVHLLFVEGEGAAMFRLRYWRTILHLMKNAYFKSVRDWCTANHLMFSGHLMGEETMESQIRATCFTMPMYQYLDLPGIDYLTAQMGWKIGEIKPAKCRFGDPPIKNYNEEKQKYGYFNVPLQCSSAAHQTGKSTVLAEMYGVSTENLGFRDQKYMFDRLAVMGVNHRSVHGIFYSLRGRGKRAYPPHVSDYQPYWPKYHVLTDALAREAAFLRTGKPIKDVLVLHPMETGFSLYHGKDYNGEYHHPALKTLDIKFNDLLRNLAAMQVNFELGDEDTIAERCSITKEGFQVGEMTYSTVVVPYMTFIRKTTLNLLKKFAECNGRILVVGDDPSMTDQGENCRQMWQNMAHADSTRKLEAYFAEAPASYRFAKHNAETDVQILMRQEDEDLLFFLMNTDCSNSARGTLTVPGQYGCQRFKELDGTVETYASVIDKENETTDVEVTLPEGGSLLLRLQKKAEVSAFEEAFVFRTQACVSSGKVRIPLTGKWNFRREDPNALVLEQYRYALEGESMSEDSYPVAALQSILQERGYSGQIMLETEFELEKDMEGLQLCMERPEKLMIVLDGEVLENKTQGTYLTFGFETIALKPLKAGRHTLRVHCHFEPLRKPKMKVTALFENLGGMELEPMLIIGNFAVRSALEPAGNTGCIRVSKDFILTGEDTQCREELISHGYPFYCGVMTMETQIEMPCDASDVTFKLEGLHAPVAQVLCNGKPCGELCWAPYEVKLQGLVPGRNTLAIRLFGTLRNLLGPWHRPVGEVGACWSGYGHPNLPWEGAFDSEDGQYYPDWYVDRSVDKPSWTESYLVLPCGIVDACLEYTCQV